MARLPRLHVPGGIYHVYARGNGKQDIFQDVDDRSYWEHLVCKGLDRHNLRLHAYCWMTNHIHAAIQVGESPLTRFIGTLLSRYAKAFNRKTGRSGHLFERRYGAKLVKDDKYLLELVRYIHQNPLRAKIVNNIGEYRWCSHSAYIGGSRPPWLTIEVVLSIFGARGHVARQQYCQFMGKQQPQSLVDQFRKGSTLDDRAVGDDAWLKDVLGKAEPEPEYESLDHLIEIVCRRHGVTEAQLSSRSRLQANARIRAEIALVAMDHGIATTTEIARRFRRSQPVISRAVSRLRDKIE